MSASKLTVGWQRESGTWLPGSPVHTMLSYVQVCAPIQSAAAASGVNRATWYDWISRAESAARLVEDPERRDPNNPDQPYIDLAHQVEHAAGIAEVLIVKRVQSASKGDWRAGIRLLEARFPERWKPTSAMEVEARQNAAASGVESREALVARVMALRGEKAARSGADLVALDGGADEDVVEAELVDDEESEAG